MADRFAEIAKIKSEKKEIIKEVSPKKNKEKKVVLKKCDRIQTKISKKIDTRDELALLLKETKSRYASFLEKHAPSLISLRRRFAVDNFMVGSKMISLPDYGGPIGYAKKVYHSSFVLEEKKPNKIYYICFSGVDYIAVIYVNGIFVGRHEGFFSPFEFDITSSVNQGTNKIVIEVFNDCVYMGNEDVNGNEVIEGDKLYAATGLGWNDPETGWHHCPPGMGIYGDVYVEEREKEYINDVFVRTDFQNKSVEIWIEAYNDEYDLKNLTFSIDIYGGNFSCDLLKGKKYHTVSNNSGFLCSSDEDNKDGSILYCKKGVNEYKIKIDLPQVKTWEPDNPYLYEVQVGLIYNGQIKDNFARRFGIRSFTQDTVSNKKGMFYLNDKKIKLRGANTMGFEQQDVLRKDFNQLVDDILLAKICNMNFLRLTQRPVQKEIYDYCDMLGMMVQTDLPLFGVMRRTKFAEGVRQAEEMERIVRIHPSCIIDSLINEPFPNAYNEPHRHLRRNELVNFFKACEFIIKLNNPDRIIKYVDGDYDPPCESMPDNHCYNFWYNGHNIDAGKMIKGYWCPVKSNWYYGCGEFGVEGLDFSDVMKKYYPKEWIKEPFDPSNIKKAQTGAFYSYFYPKQYSTECWVSESQRHQAEAVKIMTESFRRNDDMISFAIHLFIDAWPSGWMKSIMDCERKPKPAYFAYRNALEPVTLSLRTDRLTYYVGEEIKIETYLLNDTNDSINYNVKYELIRENGRVVAEGSKQICSNPMTSSYVHSPTFIAPETNDREKYILRAILYKNTKEINYSDCQIEVFAKEKDVSCDNNTIWITDLTVGEHQIAGEKVVVKNLPMGPAHFVAMDENSDITDKFKPLDFRFWYNKSADMITPICSKSFTAENFTHILIAPDAQWNNPDSEKKKIESCAVAEKYYDGKRYIISLLEIRTENPVAQRFLNYMNNKVR